MDLLKWGKRKERWAVCARDVVFSNSLTYPNLFWSQIRQDYPLNLSISVSGGKETNKDSPSSGE